MSDDIKARLEYLRSQIDAECISYGELSDLQGLADHIDESDVQLLEWAGVPEHGQIVSDEPDPVTGERLFWSNEDGWVARNDADVFTVHEQRATSLPPGGQWIDVNAVTP